jgi:hypothetical protein
MYFAIPQLFFYSTDSLKRHLGHFLAKKPVFWSLLTLFDQFQSQISQSFCDIEINEFFFEHKNISFTWFFAISRGKWSYMKRKIVWGKAKHLCYFSGKQV